MNDVCLIRKYENEVAALWRQVMDMSEELDKVCEKHGRATKHVAKIKDKLRAYETRNYYLSGRVKNLKEEIQGMAEIANVNTAYIAMTLQAFGCTSEETGVELDINEISQSLDKLEVIGVPTGGTKIKMFAREKEAQ